MKFNVVSFPRPGSSSAPRQLAQIDIGPQVSVEDFKRELAKKIPYPPERQRILTGTERDSPAFDDSKKLSDYNLQDGATLYFKDLGPQISWKGVFLTEYFGPLALYTLLYFQPSIIYGQTRERSFVQILAFYCWSAHYLKREFETLFIHRFSHGTMPLLNLFKNCMYYWGNALFVAYFVNHPLYTPPSNRLVAIGFALFLANEIGNLATHIILMNLRPPGTRERRIPKGFLFEYISCPNYFCEIMAWIGFSIMTQTLTAYIFTLLGAAQMLVWAQKKHSQYRKEFPDYPRSRKILIPFIY